LNFAFSILDTISGNVFLAEIFRMINHFFKEHLCSWRNNKALVQLVVTIEGFDVL
jgi:hypothetical protein